MPHRESLSATFAHRWRWSVVGLTLIVVTALVVGFGLASRAAENDRLRQWTEQQAVPSVALISPGHAAATSSLELPGRLEAFTQAELFARVNGYLKKWHVDMGARVKAGDLLAEIETPELDQQWQQARADLATAKADAALAMSTAKRWKGLLSSESVSAQEVDEKDGVAAAKQAALKSAQANLERYAAMKRFARIVAPFDGLVTARNTDVGALIAPNAGAPLFVVSNVGKLRVYVSVPQNYMAELSAGISAAVKVPDRPGHVYSASVTATAGAVDAASGTSLVQLSVDNSAGELLPGGYASVSLELPRNAAMLNVPASALIIGSEGTRVAMLGPDGRILLKTVKIARDLGKSIDIASGLAPDDQLVDNPPDGIANGDLVRVASNDPPKLAAMPGH